MPSARCRGPKGAGSRKVPKEPGRTRKPGPGEIEGTREARKEPEKPGRSPRSPEGAERKRGTRRTTGPSSVFLSSFVCLASRWPAAPPTVCRHPACFVRFSSCSAGRWPVVPRAVLRPLADFVCRACSVGSVGSIGPLVRRVHWRRRGSVDARTLPRPAPSVCIEAAEKRAAARLGAGRRMHAARTSGPDADNGSSPHSKPARTDLPRLGHFSSEHLRTERSRAGYFPLGPPCSGHLHSRSSAPAVPSRPLPDTPAQAGNSSGWLLT